MLRQAIRRKPPEPTITLINIVFLMLIFFLIAGTVAPQRDKDMTLVQTDRLDPAAPPDALLLDAEGLLSYRGAAVDAVTYVGAGGEAVRLVPDRDVPATHLIAVANALRDAGATSVILVTEQSLE